MGKHEQDNIYLKKPKQLIVTITDQCNHSCDMCYYHNSLNIGQKLMTIAEYELLAAQLPKLNLILLSGGEPFLRKDLVDIIKVFYTKSQVRQLFIPTNGSIPNTIIKKVKMMLSTMPKLQLTIMFSLEGLEEEHDKIHGMKGAFKSVIESIRRLSIVRVHQCIKRKPPLALLLNSVVSNSNIDGILPLMRYIRSTVKVNTHTFSPMRGTGPAINWEAPDPDKFSKLIQSAQHYFEYYLSHEPEALQATLERYSLWLRLIRGKGLPFQCQAGNNIGVIEPDSSIRLCELTPIVGNLRETNYDFDKVWFGSMASEIRRKIIGCSCTHSCFINASQKHYAEIQQEKT